MWVSPKLLVALVWTTRCGATLVNITVDDTDGSAWTWNGKWNAITEGNPCKNCLSKPDGNQAFNHSWHDGLLLSGSFKFRGVAVYIYGIDVFNPANVTFSSDKPSLSAFHYADTGSPQKYSYNSLFFAAGDLDGTQEHTILFNETAMPKSSGQPPGRVALLDYAVVTVDQETLPGPPSGQPQSPEGSGTLSAQPTSQPSRPGSTGKTNNTTWLIVGGILGGLAVLSFLAGAAIFVLCRRRQRGRRSERRDSFASTSQLTQSNGFPPSVTIPSTILSTEPSGPPEMTTSKGNPLVVQNHNTDPAPPHQVAEVERRLRVLEEMVQGAAPPAYT